MANKFRSTQQWHEGSDVADFLDQFFRDRGWTVTPTTAYEERYLCEGDRHFSRGTSTRFLVEYKSGTQTVHTGNVFLETISVDSSNVPGWVYTCRANYVFYAILPFNEILVLEPSKLRMVIEDLKTQFKIGKTKDQNRGYRTHGVCVPLAYAKENLVKKVISTL